MGLFWKGDYCGGFEAGWYPRGGQRDVIDGGEDVCELRGAVLEHPAQYSVRPGCFPDVDAAESAPHLVCGQDWGWGCEGKWGRGRVGVLLVEAGIKDI